MGTCYRLIEPVTQQTLWVGKGGWMFGLDGNQPWTRADIATAEVNEPDATWPLSADDLAAVLRWMDEQCGGHPVYAWADTSPTCFPPVCGPEVFAWGEDARVDGWTERDITAAQ